LYIYWYYLLQLRIYCLYDSCFRFIDILAFGQLYFVPYPNPNPNIYNCSWRLSSYITLGTTVGKPCLLLSSFH
jgi:hypothetical protein